MVAAEVSKYLNFTVQPNCFVFSHMLVVFTDSEWHDFGLFQSTIHEVWARDKGSTLETRFRYTPTDCVGTFPLPQTLLGISESGRAYYEFRRGIMLASKEGLTKTYNRFHDPEESAADSKKLRDLHVEMDKAVSAAYGWSDQDLGHGFHETKQGTRFTISESARREVLTRLLKLNHERYAEEVAQGLHDKKCKAKPASSGRGRKSKASSGTPSLFRDDDAAG
jgi:hypothetical protein